jgi:acyl-CoA reductase-like NAD-dependent aldehyde dehydrogenase
MSERVDVRKTYKLFLGGAFPRSESGRSYEVFDATGAWLANAARASRKDVRDAVVAARNAWSPWAALSAYNRGQILYRVAEVMEARRAELIDEVERAEGDDTSPQVDEAIDRWVYYAGWSDKLAHIAGGVNPVTGAYFNLSVPEPTGVTGIVAPEKPSLLGLVDRIAPALCGGNSVVALVSEPHPLVALSLGECLATSDVPKGVVNLLTGAKEELVPVLAAHMDIDALDVTGIGDRDLNAAETAAASNVKRIVRSSGTPGPYEVTAFMEIKTVWHPKGA